MSLHHTAGIVESQPVATHLVSVARGYTIELFEDVRQVVWGYARAIVANRDYCCAALLRTMQYYVKFARGVFQRVVDNGG